jgi:hypothetical protein
MIVEIGVTDDPERVGFYSGLIVSGIWLEEDVSNVCNLGIRILSHESHYE